jgi:four helix bundle protein
MNSDALKDRTKEFALRIIKLVGALPKTTSGRALGNQLVRSGTSVGANYRAACRARSPAEFVARIGTVEEEADETAFWLELIVDGKLLPEPRIRSLLDEANEIIAIMASSYISAARNAKNARANGNQRSEIGNQKSRL